MDKIPTIRTGRHIMLDELCQRLKAGQTLDQIPKPPPRVKRVGTAAATMGPAASDFGLTTYEPSKEPTPWWVTLFYAVAIPVAIYTMFDDAVVGRHHECNPGYYQTSDC